MTSNQPSAPERAHIEGSLRSGGGVCIAHVETTLSSRIDDVWSALADPDRLGRWLGSFDGNLEIGGRFHARFLASEWEGTGRVDVCNPMARLIVTLVQADASNPHVMEVKLEAEGERTRLVVEEVGMPLNQLAAFGAGLQIHVEDLAAYLAGGGRCDAPARWKELFPLFQAKPVEVERITDQ